MKTWYKADLVNFTVEPVKVDKETERCVVSRMFLYRKKTSTHVFARTKKEAVEIIIGYLEKEIEHATEKLKVLQEKQKQVRKITEE